MGDGLYHFTKVILISAKSLHERLKSSRLNRVENEVVALDDIQRDVVF